MKLLSFFENTAQINVIEADDFIKSDNPDLNSSLSYLSENELKRFSQFKNENAKFTFLTSRYFLRKILSQKLSLSPESIIIDIASSGKPYLKDYPSFFFNISHTKDLILLGFADSPIGVDVEHINRIVEKDSIIKHFFSEKEQQTFFSQPENQRQLAFIKGWTRKEAILKATGEGISEMQKYEVSFEPTTNTPLLRLEYINSFQVLDFIPKDGYVGCLALIKN